MMWTDIIDFMNFTFIANDAWIFWLVFILGTSLIWTIKESK